MNRIEYRNIYLKSQRWRILRAKLLDTFCFCCGEPATTNTEDCDYETWLELHHTSYRHLGELEEEKDLVTVCCNCHDRIHEMLFERMVYARKHFVIVDLEHAHLILRDKINTPRLGGVIDFSNKKSMKRILNCLKDELQNIKRATEFNWND